MSGDERGHSEGGSGRRFVRPWEDPDPADAAPDDEAPDREVLPDAAPDDEGRLEEDSPSATVGGTTSATPDDGDEATTGDAADHLAGLAEGPSGLDRFSSDDYVTATTREYRGLAEDVARADTEEFERQAVAAAMPGVGTGLIGFEDVTGRPGVSEEEVEQEEQRRASDLTLRVGSGVVVAALFLGSLLAGGAWFSAFAGLAMLLALGEFYATLRSRGYAPVAILGLLGVVGVAVAADRSGPYAMSAFVLATLVAVAFFYSLVVRRHPLQNAALTVLGLAWVSLLGYAIVIGRAEHGTALILLIVLVTAVFDMGAYFVGRAFGRRLLAPVVSPKKTVEGLVGGVFAAFALSAVLSTIPLFDPLDLTGALWLALVVTVLAPLGDAAESVVKRALDVKDMGSIMPGHGGMLDRIDALLFVVPASFYLFDLLGYL